MSIIAPNITDEDFASGRLGPIDVFEGRIKGWTLAFAKALSTTPDSGVAMLLLTSSVLEPMGGALLGSKGTANDRVEAALKTTFPSLPDGASKRVCNLLRNGLFHKGFIKAGLVLKPMDEPIRAEPGAIFIDPIAFSNSLDASFSALCAEIRSQSPASKTFLEYWDHTEENELRYKNANFRVPAALQPGVTLSTAAEVSHLFVLPDASTK